MSEAIKVPRETVTLARSLSPCTIEKIKTVRDIIGNDPNAFHIKSQADYDYVVALVKRIKSQGKLIEEARVVLVTPYLDEKKAIDAEFKVHSIWQSAQEGLAKNAMRVWDTEVQRRADVEQAKADHKARIKEQKLRDRADIAADKGDIEKAQVLDEQANATTAVQAQGVTKTEGVAKKWRIEIEITDRKAFIAAAATNPVLAACLEINETAVKKLAKMLDDEFDFPGVTSKKSRDYSI